MLKQFYLNKLTESLAPKGKAVLIMEFMFETQIKPCDDPLN